MAGSQDPWRISGEERSKHDIQFFQLKPVNGFVTGTQARDFFLQSGLPTPVLGQIWTLADVNGDGKMDKKEFSIAMHLIKKKLQGYELPKVLPPSLKADPAPVVGSFAQPTVGNIPMAQPTVGNIPMAQPMGMGFSMGGVQTSVGIGMPVIQPQASLGTATMTTGSLGLGPLMSNGISGGFSHGGMAPVSLATVPGGTVLQSGGSIWAIPPAAKMKHTQNFSISDRNKKGYLLGVEARAILMQSGLPQPVLAQIWSLSDIDRDGKLTCDEFCIAMHLTELARMGQALPATLPPELLSVKSAPGSIISNQPSAVVPGPQKDAFGDLLGNVGMPLPVAAAPPAQTVAIEDDEQVTFEDKRKENFDKGQAELERRRAILREQQQKEENERLEKERHEAEKRERQRHEVESRRQAELQKQLEKQKEREREIEEQRRKVLEQREAARRELERQRQMEWEKQRKEQLMVEKEREAEQIRMIKSQMTNLRNELETLEARKAELSLKVSQARKGVTDFTAGIDAMRMTRDKTLADIDAFERQSLALSGRVSTLENEKNGLNNQMQTAQTTPLSDAHRNIANSVELKKASILKLKKELEKIETDTEVKLREIDGSNAELKNLKVQLTKLERGLPHLQKQEEEKTTPQRKVAEVNQQSRLKGKELTSAPAIPSANENSNGQPNWFDFNSSDAFSSGTGEVTSSTPGWDSAFPGTSDADTSNNTFASWGAGGTTTGIQNKQKYRAMYDFPAGREDELTLVAGMEVWVLTDFTPIPGMEDWYKGEHDGKVGWFPKSYVERLDEPSTDLFGGAFESLVQSSNVQTSETSKQDIFTSQLSQQSSAISSAPATSSVNASVPSDIPPEGLLAKAIYPWKARQETDLPFDKDDIILVKEQDDMKWFGELNGKSGWFPKAYVKITGAAPKPGPAVNNVMKPTEISTAPTDSQGEYYSAMYAYASDEPADLTFNEGDIIYVTSSAGDWWTGTIADQNKSGIFPASYVKKLEIQPMKRGVSGHIESSFDSLLGDFSSVFSPASAKTPSTSLVDDLPASPVGAQPKSDVDQVDAQVLNQDGGAGFSSAGSMGKINAAGSSETKSDQSLSTSVSFDGSGILELATSSAATTVLHKTDIGLAEMASHKSNLGVSDDMLDLSLNLSIQSSHADTSGLEKEGTLGHNIVDSHGQLIISRESFIDNDPIANLPSSPLGKEISKLEIKDEKSSTLGSSNGVTHDLDWSFGDFEKPSVSIPTTSDFSLLDDFGLISSSDLSKPAVGRATSQGQLLDIMDDFGFGTSDSSSNMKSSSKFSMSLPDILAMENDAILGDLMEAQSTADILKSHEIPLSAGRTTSVVQVNFDRKKQKIGSKKAPIPPAPTSTAATPSVPHIRSVAKTLFGRMKKKTPEQKSVKKPEIARVIAPYVATGTGQLSLEVGNLINVRQKSPRGWWEGELQVRGQKKKTGWFPANYVKLLSSTSARSTPEPTGAAALSLSDHAFRSATPQGTSSQDATFSITQPDTVVALYSYVAQNDDELTFQKDDVITVLNRDNPSWWSGQDSKCTVELLTTKLGIVIDCC